MDKAQRQGKAYSAREQAERNVASRLGITLGELYERARRHANVYDLIQAQLYANLRGGGQGEMEEHAWTCQDARAMAERLGREHGQQGKQPFGDLADGGDALLLSALGITSPTTEENAPLRWQVIEAYETARESAQACD